MLAIRTRYQRISSETEHARAVQTAPRVSNLRARRRRTRDANAVATKGASEDLILRCGCDLPAAIMAPRVSLSTEPVTRLMTRAWDMRLRLDTRSSAVIECRAISLSVERARTRCARWRRSAVAGRLRSKV